MAHEKDRMGSHEVLVCPVQLPLRSISHAGMVAGESLVRREVNSNSYWALCSPMFQLCGLWLAWASSVWYCTVSAWYQLHITTT